MTERNMEIERGVERMGSGVHLDFIDIVDPLNDGGDPDHLHKVDPLN